MEQREQSFKTGQGNWEACDLELATIREAARDWQSQLAGVERGWLCWNVDPDWCLLQQRLVLHAGWTPIVGFDPRVGPPRWVEPGAVLVDFNRRLKLPVLYPHFPLEFAFLFVRRIAFWHSDLLLRLDRLAAIARQFERLADGQTAAVPERRLRHLLLPRKHRYWELIGCTTAEASRSQFEAGCGWWMNFWWHPNQPRRGDPALARHNWDHGGGIMHWSRRHGGSMVEIPLSSVEEGHFTQSGNPAYKRVSPKHHMRQMHAELALNFELARCASSLGLQDFLGTSGRESRAA